MSAAQADALTMVTLIVCEAPLALFLIAELSGAIIRRWVR